MNPKILMVVLVGWAVAPPGVAHSPAGTPDFTCQSSAEWVVHDYVVSNGQTLAGISDNNLEECGTTHGLFLAGDFECSEIEYRLGSGPGRFLWQVLCDTDRPADYDGDFEFALGGALLAVDSGDGATRGSLVCMGTWGHHHNVVTVDDEVFGDVIFSVTADASLEPPPTGQPDCGDGVARPCDASQSGLGPVADAVLDLITYGACNPEDRRVTCMGSCWVPFGPGADGSYVVLVHPTLDRGSGGSPTGASHGHVSA